MAKVKAEFFRAAEKGNIEKLRSILDDNPDAHKAYSSGVQAIHLAADSNQPAAIELLLSRGADINAAAEGGKTAVVFAAGNGSVDALRVLIANHADLDKTDISGQSALIWALRKRPETRQVVAKMLLDAGASYGVNEAVCNGDLEGLKLIICRDPRAIQNIKMKPEVLVRLLTFGRFEGETLDHVAIFKLLMDYGWSVPKKILVSESEACENSRRPLLAEILRQYSSTASDDLPKTETTQTSKGSKRGKKKAKPIELISNLCKAAAAGDLDTCRACLATNPGIIGEEYEELQPIHWAAQENRGEVIAFLIEKGADVDALAGENARSPLYYAVEGGLEAVKVLLKHKADPNVIDMEGYSPMAFAIAEQLSEADEIIKLLLSVGATYGIMEAAGMGDLNQIKAILKSDPAAIEKVSSQELLLTLLLHVGNFGKLADREKILPLLFEHGLNLSSEQLLQHANSCEVSNIGRFGKLLRDHVANTGT